MYRRAPALFTAAGCLGESKQRTSVAGSLGAMCWRVLSAAVVSTVVLVSPGFADSNLDALAPKSSAADARTGPLHTVTISTNSLAESLLFYREGLGLAVEGPLPVSPEVKAQQRVLWDLEEGIDWDEYRLTRAGVDGIIALRLRNSSKWSSL